MRVVREDANDVEREGANGDGCETRGEDEDRFRYHVGNMGAMPVYNARVIIHWTQVRTQVDTGFAVLVFRTQSPLRTWLHHSFQLCC